MGAAEIITIDGPAGAGKSTIGRELARRLGYTFLDTGAMYRAVAWVAKVRGIDLADEAALAILCDGLDLRLVGAQVLVDGIDVAGAIRTLEVDKLSSDVSRVGVVRRFLSGLQQCLGAKGRLVAEGRDMGTEVFPHAALKIFLTATPEERARRRYTQLLEQGKFAKYVEVLAQIRARDAADESRSLAPLRPASEAIVVDTSDLPFKRVLDCLLNHTLRVLGQASQTPG